MRLKCWRATLMLKIVDFSAKVIDFPIVRVRFCASWVKSSVILADPGLEPGEPGPIAQMLGVVPFGELDPG
jgi:hypothetical protein